MNIHDKIEKIFSQTRADAPEWAIELLQELKEIKQMLHAQTPQPNQAHYQPQNNSSFYDFVSDFRESMKADIINNIYPEVEYQNKKIGVNFKGLLYYKSDSSLLNRDEAFRVYRFLYESKSKAV